MRRRTFLQTVAGATAVSATAQTRTERPPNLVFIMADDMGYADLGCFGATDIRTPHIDRIASRGARFTDCYANAPICTPTRVGFLTGQYQQRFGPELELPLGPHNNKTAGLLPSQSELPGALKRAGYRTGAFGKWHVGWNPEYRPLQHGFDEYFGTLLGNADMYTHRYHDNSEDLWDGNELVEREGYLTELLAERAVQFVEKSADDPFFLYLPFNAVHWPFQPPGHPEQLATPENWRDGVREDYAAMVESMDTAVGQVVDALERTGTADNTLLVFTNDNGGERLSDNGPFFHTKATVFEGGVRVPAVVQWPGVIPEGATCDQVCASMDFTATFLKAAGAEPRATLDGVDLRSVFEDPNATFERPLFWRVLTDGRQQRAARIGKWKYIDDGIGARGLPELLFDLETDPGERKNLYYRNQELAADMRRQYLAWERDVEASAARI